MAKLTVAALKTLVALQMDADKIGVALPLTPDINSFTKLTEKIGKQLMLDSDFSDRFGELDGEELPFGTTIEEYFVNMVLPTDYDPSGATALQPKRASFEDAAYSFALDRKTFATTIDDAKYESSMLGLSQYSSLVAQVTKQFHDSKTLYKERLKMQLLGRFIEKVPANSASTTMITDLAIPTDTSTGESFVKQVKKQVTELSLFSTETNNIGKVVARAPELVLYVKSSAILPVLDVDVLAGAFNSSRVEIPVTVKQVDNFGVLDVNENTWAILMDPRGVRLHGHQDNYTSEYNAVGEYNTLYNHYTPVGFISKFTNVHIWRTGPDAE